MARSPCRSHPCGRPAGFRKRHRGLAPRHRRSQRRRRSGWRKIRRRRPRRSRLPARSFRQSPIATGALSPQPCRNRRDRRRSPGETSLRLPNPTTASRSFRAPRPGAYRCRWQRQDRSDRGTRRSMPSHRHRGESRGRARYRHSGGRRYRQRPSRRKRRRRTIAGNS